ncbi:hypothetical protein ACOI99_13755 [Corynebacterium striatum]|uniref:hypothetical protein n=1 Tax=Corynebacterium striatum TaxID=43770 RepID=UPI003B5AD712
MFQIFPSTQTEQNLGHFKACMSASWIAASVLFVAIALVAVGALGKGLLSMLGIPDGVSALWGHVQEANGIGPTLGWLALTWGCPQIVDT